MSKSNDCRAQQAKIDRVELMCRPATSIQHAHDVESINFSRERHADYFPMEIHYFDR